MNKLGVPTLPKQKHPGEEVYERKPLGDADFKKTIRSIGIKVTGQRIKILRALHQGSQHMTVQEVFEALEGTSPEVGFATVYRFLRTLSEKGVVTEVQIPGGTSVKYELTPEDHHHDHIVCTKCGKIIEFHNEDIERIQEEISERLGFNLESHRMELYGTCSDCKPKIKP